MLALGFERMREQRQLIVCEPLVEALPKCGQRVELHLRIAGSG